MFCSFFCSCFTDIDERPSNRYIIKGNTDKSRSRELELTGARTHSFSLQYMMRYMPAAQDKKLNLESRIEFTFGHI